MALTNKLTAIGDAIRNKTGSTNLLTLDEMPTAIESIEGGGGGGFDEEDLTFTGDCSYKFAYSGWNGFLEKYKNKIITKDITDTSYMFANNKIREIPIDIKLITSGNGAKCNYMFDHCDIITPPKIIGKIANIGYLFDYCIKLESIPDDWSDNIDWTYLHTFSSADLRGVFCRCYHLKAIPSSLIGCIKSTSTSASALYSPYKDTFYYCYILGEVKDFPVIPATYTSNTFSSTFYSCARLKGFTFTTDNGTPYVVNWKSQTMDFTGVGYSVAESTFTSTNMGAMTDGVCIKDDTTYQQYKDNENAYSIKTEYSRYNRASAVETINSLPDASAYLANKGGTNTIKFTGASGSSTDAGAINTMTEEEIAVATAKGWTVTFV